MKGYFDGESMPPMGRTEILRVQPLSPWHRYRRRAALAKFSSTGTMSAKARQASVMLTP